MYKTVLFISLSSLIVMIIIMKLGFLNEGIIGLFIITFILCCLLSLRDKGCLKWITFSFLLGLLVVVKELLLPLRRC
jgi:hypothetical protein